MEQWAEGSEGTEGAGAGKAES